MLRVAFDEQIFLLQQAGGVSRYFVELATGPVSRAMIQAFFVDLPWPQISLALLALRYADPANGIRYAEETVTLDATTTHLTRTYSIASGGSRALEYRLTIQRSDGGLVDGSWREATDDRVIVDRRLVDDRQVRIKVLGTLAERHLVRATLRVEAREADVFTHLVAALLAVEADDAETCRRDLDGIQGIHGVRIQHEVEGVVLLGGLVVPQAGAGGRGLSCRARGARTALFMLVMVGVHSLLEYPLWYVYFLLPAAMLAGLGTPWNTLQIEGQLSLLMQGLSVEWNAGRVLVAGRAIASGPLARGRRLCRSLPFRGSILCGRRVGIDRGLERVAVVLLLLVGDVPHRREVSLTRAVLRRARDSLTHRIGHAPRLRFVAGLSHLGVMRGHERGASGLRQTHPVEQRGEVRRSDCLVAHVVTSPGT